MKRNKLGVNIGSSGRCDGGRDKEKRRSHGEDRDNE